MILGPLQFDAPAWLLVAPVLWVASVLLSRKSLSGLDARMRIGALVVRCLVLAVLAGVLAQPNWRREAEDVSVVVVADVSRSMPSGSPRALAEFLGSVAPESEPADRIGVVTTAERALAELIPSSLRPARVVAPGLDPDRWTRAGLDGTNLADGVTLAMALSNQDAATRILLVSDGNETESSVLAAARTARASGIPIDVLLVPYDLDREVIFDSIVAPSTARQGQTVNVRFAMTALAPTSGTVTLMANGVPVDLSPEESGPSDRIDLEVGKNVITLPMRLDRSGPQVFEAIFEPDDPDADRLLQNNRARAVTFVQGEGRVLLFANDHNAAVPVRDAMVGADVGVEVRYPSEAFEDLTELQAFDAIVLFDVAAADFTLDQHELIHAFVYDTGGGLVMVGGPNSFGAGGWIGSRVAEALPVEMDPPQRRQMPKGALAVVLDASGSMASPVQGTGINQSEAANEAAIAAINSLSRLDLVCAISFDSSPRVAVPLTENSDPEAIARRIRTIGPGGGTDMFPAIRRALEELQDANAGAKHIIVLSDGQTMDDGSLNGIIDTCQRQSVTISTVSIGSGSNDPLMQNLARVTGGSWYAVNSANGLAQLPQIFIKEAQLVRRSLIWEEERIEVGITGFAAEPMQGIGPGLPPMTGYVVTGQREGLALATITGPYDDPICAQWQYGLGRAVAFTSDATSRWCTDWLSWGQFRAFWDQHIRWVMRPSGSASVDVFTRSSGTETRVVVSALDANGDPLNFARFRGRLSNPDLSSDSLDLRQTAPGRYEASFPSAGSGTYLANLSYQTPASDGSGVDRGTIQAAYSRPFADEHRFLRDNTGLLRQVADITGGRVIAPDQPENAALFSRDGLAMPVALRPIWLAALVAALGLFLVDVGVRRVRVDVRAGIAAIRRGAKRKAAPEGAGVGALQTAREKAAARVAGNPETASQKFDAPDPAVSPVPITRVGDAEKPPIERVRAQVETDDDDDEAGGMSRLMKAKRRAREGMDGPNRDEQ